MKKDGPLRLHIPEARFRPGDVPDFSYLQLPKAGAVDAAGDRCQGLGHPRSGLWPGAGPRRGRHRGGRLGPEA